MMTAMSLLIFSENPAMLVDFYTSVLQKEPDWSGGDFKGYKIGSSGFVIGPHDKVHGKSVQPERMMFNLEVTDVKAEFERIKAMGTAVVAEPYQPGEDTTMWVATFVDPDGNYFQITTPFKEEQ